jgi:hypothetical protein
MCGLVRYKPAAVGLCEHGSRNSASIETEHFMTSIKNYKLPSNSLRRVFRVLDLGCLSRINSTLREVTFSMLLLEQVTCVLSTIKTLAVCIMEMPFTWHNAKQDRNSWHFSAKPLHDVREQYMPVIFNSGI